MQKYKLERGGETFSDFIEALLLVSNTTFLIPPVLRSRLTEPVGPGTAGIVNFEEVSRKSVKNTKRHRALRVMARFS